MRLKQTRGALLVLATGGARPPEPANHVLIICSTIKGSVIDNGR